MVKLCQYFFGFMFSGIAVASFMPENNFNLQDDIHAKLTTMDEAKFLEISNRVMDYYRPIVRAHGATLNLVPDWNNTEVNARAGKAGSNWNVFMYGGLARRSELTEDGFLVVVCHETGHLVGGSPTYTGNPGAATEGQSDYFATQSCAMKVLANDLDINATFRDTVNPTAKAGCDDIWATEAEQNLCYRVAMASYSAADLLGTLFREPKVSFDKKDAGVVSRTFESHPKAQCRLDTYFAGALCIVEFDDALIPRTRSEVENTSCVRVNGFDVSTRPLCWYKP